MKIIHLILVTFFINGCATQEQKKDILTVYDLAKKIEHEDKFYYIVEIGDLKRVNKPAAITYVGTIDSYHLFTEWSKIEVKKGEIFSFAVRKNSCVVHDEATPLNENYYYTNIFRQWRHVSIENGKCFVPPRRVSPSEGGGE